MAVPHQWEIINLLLAGFFQNTKRVTFPFAMSENLKHLNTEELKDLFIKETRRFMQGIDQGLSFDKLKEIRVTLRQIEAELHERGVSV